MRSVLRNISALVNIVDLCKLTISIEALELIATLFGFEGSKLIIGKSLPSINPILAYLHCKYYRDIVSSSDCYIIRINSNNRSVTWPTKYIDTNESFEEVILNEFGAVDKDIIYCPSILKDIYLKLLGVLEIKVSSCRHLQHKYELHKSLDWRIKVILFNISDLFITKNSILRTSLKQLSDDLSDAVSYFNDLYKFSRRLKLYNSTLVVKNSWNTIRNLLLAKYYNELYTHTIINYNDLVKFSKIATSIKEHNKIDGFLSRNYLRHDLLCSFLTSYNHNNHHTRIFEISESFDVKNDKVSTSIMFATVDDFGDYYQNQISEILSVSGSPARWYVIGSLSKEVKNLYYIPINGDTFSIGSCLKYGKFVISEMFLDAVLDRIDYQLVTFIHQNIKNKLKIGIVRYWLFYSFSSIIDIQLIETYHNKVTLRIGLTDTDIVDEIYNTCLYL